MIRACAVARGYTVEVRAEKAPNGAGLIRKFCSEKSGAIHKITDRMDQEEYHESL